MGRSSMLIAVLSRGGAGASAGYGLLGHDAAYLGTLDQTVEQDDERLLVFIAEQVNLLVQAMKFHVVDPAFAAHLLPAEQFI